MLKALALAVNFLCESYCCKHEEVLFAEHQLHLFCLLVPMKDSSWTTCMNLPRNPDINIGITAGNGQRSSYTVPRLLGVISHSQTVCAAPSFSRLSWSTLLSQKQISRGMAVGNLAGWKTLMPTTTRVFEIQLVLLLFKRPVTVKCHRAALLSSVLSRLHKVP